MLDNDDEGSEGLVGARLVCMMKLTLKQSLSLRHLTSSVKRPWQLLDIFSTFRMSHIICKFVFSCANMRPSSHFCGVQNFRKFKLADMEQKEREVSVYFRASAHVAHY